MQCFLRLQGHQIGACLLPCNTTFFKG